MAAEQANPQRQLLPSTISSKPSWPDDVRQESLSAMLNDQEIMERVCAGRVELFDELVRRHQASMLRAAVSKLRDQAVAEEAVQDAFMAAYAHRHTFRLELSFRGWLWTILLNVCRKLAKRELGRADRAGKSQEYTQSIEPSSSDDALSRLVRVEQTTLLFRHLAELPEVQADALRLRFFGGLKFDEIAHAMNCSKNGAKQRVRAGLERLATVLQRTNSISSDRESIEASRNRDCRGDSE